MSSPTHLKDSPRPASLQSSPQRQGSGPRHHDGHPEHHLPIVLEETGSPGSSAANTPRAESLQVQQAPVGASFVPSPFESTALPSKEGALLADGAGGSSVASPANGDKQATSTAVPTPFPLSPDRRAMGLLRPVSSRHATSNPLFDGIETPEGEVLHCPTMRHLLKPMPSPFTEEGLFGAGFVSDEDRVSLQPLLFATPTSRGASEVQTRMGGLVPRPRSGIAAAAHALTRCLSTPRSSDAYFADAVPRFALRAGPRSTIYFQPKSTKIAVVTAGSLCPGLNDVIRALVLKALDYGVKEGNILGIRRGYPGFYNKHLKPVLLTRESVEDIHLEGGTVLGTCETGECDVMAVVKMLDLWAIDMLFVIGGRQEISSAGAIQSMCERLNVPCAIVALPKSIDNDLLLLDKCFGYETAVEEAQNALLAAKVEATSAYRGVGIVKLMGKHSGFIAVKVPFRLEAVLSHLEKILEERGHVVVCIAEGAGQELFPHCSLDSDPFECRETDVGFWLKAEICKHVPDVDCKYIDPSYILRSIPATSDDRVHCKMVAHGAVHAAFAGYTGVAVGQLNNYMVLLPLSSLAKAPRQMDPHGELWGRLRAAIGQPNF
ncbi:hypothetical protein ABPG77_010991 [Micractinium sp. CCAP 211/92]